MWSSKGFSRCWQAQPSRLIQASHRFWIIRPTKMPKTLMIRRYGNQDDKKKEEKTQRVKIRLMHDILSVVRLILAHAVPL